MARSFAEHLCSFRGGRVGAASERILRAAFGRNDPGDDEVDENGDEFANASEFDAEGRYLADGGEVKADPSDFPKRERDLPDVRPPWYEGETAKAEHAAREAKEREEDEDAPPPQVASRYAEGGPVKAKLGSGKRFAHLTHQLEGRGNVADPKALAATIGREKLGAGKMEKLAAAHRAFGGPIDAQSKPSFTDHMARRLRIRRAMGGER